MKISLVEFIIHLRNSFPQKGRIIKKLGANKILSVNPNPDFNMKVFFWILRHGINRGRKHHRAQEHTYHIIEGIQQIWRTFIHVAIRWKNYPQQRLGGITYIKRCCKKGRKASQNWKTDHFWPISNIWMGTRNTNHGQHDRKWVHKTKWINLWKWNHGRYCWGNYRRRRHIWKSTLRFLDIRWIWHQRPQPWYTRELDRINLRHRKK